MNPRILIVDDHEIVREGIRNLLARSGKDWEVCGEASNASDAILAIKSLQPDVVVLDVSMPGISGLEAARLIGKLDLAVRVLIFPQVLPCKHAKSALMVTFRNLKPPAISCLLFRLCCPAALFSASRLTLPRASTKIPTVA